MPTLEEDIRSFLRDRRVKYIWDSHTFRTKIRDSQQAAEILIDIMRSGPEEVAIRAENTLGMCTDTALLPILKALTQETEEKEKSVLWKLSLLTAAKLIVLNSEAVSSSKEIDKALQELSLYFMKVLNDRRVPSPLPIDEYVEEDYLDDRICDKAHLLLLLLRGRSFEEYIFRDKEYSERDKDVRGSKRYLRSLDSRLGLVA